jgi:hypothetical protein
MSAEYGVYEYDTAVGSSSGALFGPPSYVFPNGASVAADPSGDVFVGYVASYPYGPNGIFEITPNGSVHPFATSADCDDLKTDTNGNLFMAGVLNDVYGIYEFSPSGTPTLFASGSGLSSGGKSVD